MVTINNNPFMILDIYDLPLCHEEILKCFDIPDGRAYVP